MEDWQPHHNLGDITKVLRQASTLGRGRGLPYKQGGGRTWPGRWSRCRTL